MAFASPHYLWLLLLLPVVIMMVLRSSGPRRWLNAALRTLCVTAIVLAMAHPVIDVARPDEVTVLVVDLGPTMRDDVGNVVGDQLKRFAALGRRNVKLVGFSNRARVVPDATLFSDAVRFKTFRDDIARPLALDDPPAGGSALAAGLQLAGSLIPQTARGGVWVYSSGLCSRGDATAEAFRLAERGITLTTSAVSPAENGPSIVVSRVLTPSAAKANETIAADVEIESRSAVSARITVSAGNGNNASVAAALHAGKNTVRVPVAFETQGLQKLTATVSIDKSSVAGDSGITGAIQVTGAPRVVVVESQDSNAAQTALARLLAGSARVDRITPTDLAKDSLTDASAVVLADVPAAQLDGSVQAKIRHAVLDGAGLFVTGAGRSFGPGGYDSSDLAALLPVKTPQLMENIDPSTTLALIIDTSGSMSENDRINLAKEVARLAISHLKRQDKVGIVEFYGGKRWAAPIQSASNVGVITRALNRLTVGGGTTLYPAVEEAAFAMRNVSTRGKHVLIISDGGVEDAPFATLFRQMADDGIAVSTVAVAPEPGPNIMPELARWGTGRFYTVPDRFVIPDITFKEPQATLLSTLVQTPATVVAGVGDGAAEIDTAGWQPLNGYVRTSAKPTADVLLRTADSGDPVLVRWRYGAGYVAAMPTQLGSAMSAGLQDQPGFAKMIADLFRKLEGTGGENLTITPTVRPGGVEIDVASSANDPPLDTATMRITLTANGDDARTVDVEPMGMGHWNAYLPGVTAGAYTIAAESADGVQTRGAVAVPAPAAWPGVSADTALLRALAGFNAMAASQVRALPGTSLVFIDLQNSLVIAAIVLLLLHILARRLPLMARRKS